MSTTDPFETDESNAASEGARASETPSSARPDWLVGAEEGVDAELARRKNAEAGADAPVLKRRELPQEEIEGRPRWTSPGPVSLSRPAEPEATGAGPVPKAPAAQPAKPVAWTAAASSVPSLRVIRGQGPERPAPPARALQPDDLLAEFPDDSGPPQPHLAAVGPGTAGASGAPAPRVAPPRESWWLVAVDAVRTQPRVQVLLGLLVVILAAWIFWPRTSHSVQVSDILLHAERWDGRTVEVSGRTGEVFPLGGSYAFNLHSGSDTLVVFTRSRVPRPRQRVTVSGTVSTGYLDGVPRMSLFENTHK
jgi:hypothetical protein